MRKKDSNEVERDLPRQCRYDNSKGHDRCGFWARAAICSSDPFDSDPMPSNEALTEN